MEKNQKQELDCPGGVYLCQINESVSCGACCGLYNLPNLYHEDLVKNLRVRTDAFSKTPREVSNILCFGEKLCHDTQKNAPFPEFHHCPYVGLIGDEFTRIGCLLHPLADKNNGVDFRGLSYYGGMACRIYFCPSYRLIPDRVKMIIRATIKDWYAYGLIITEWDFINSCFQEIEARLGSRLYLNSISEHALSYIGQLLRIKLNWPFRSPRWPVVNYFFQDRTDRPPEIKYKKMGSKPSCYHSILYSLASYFSSKQELQNAENILNCHFENIVKSIVNVR